MSSNDEKVRDFEGFSEGRAAGTCFKSARKLERSFPDAAKNRTVFWDFFGHGVCGIGDFVVEFSRHEVCGIGEMSGMSLAAEVAQMR